MTMRCAYCDRAATVEMKAGGGRPVCAEHLASLVPSRLELATRVSDLEQTVAELREQVKSDASGVER